MASWIADADASLPRAHIAFITSSSRSENRGRAMTTNVVDRRSIVNYICRCSRNGHRVLARIVGFISINMRPRILTLATLLLFHAAMLSAQAGDSARDLVKTWTHRMAETESALKASDYAEALRLADRTVTEMVERLGPGEGSTNLLGTALTHKALAHAGLGQQDE